MEKHRDEICRFTLSDPKTEKEHPFSIINMLFMGAICFHFFPQHLLNITFPIQYFSTHLDMRDLTAIAIVLGGKSDTEYKENWGDPRLPKQEVKSEKAQRNSPKIQKKDRGKGM